MKFRDHPLTHSGSVCNWPPVWTDLATGRQILRGEIGILKRIAPKEPADYKFSLVIEHENAFYFTSLVFDDLMFGRLVYTMLKEHIGHPIAEIGGLDLSFSL